MIVYLAEIRLVSITFVTSDCLKKVSAIRINPHEIIPATAEDKRTAHYRQNILGIPSFHATFNGQTSNELSQYPGYPHGVQYGMKPQNRFQMWLRKEMGEDGELEGHYTKRFSYRVIEACVFLFIFIFIASEQVMGWDRTTTVLLEPGADHNGDHEWFHIMIS